MNRTASWLWAGCFCGLLGSSASGATLASYLLFPADRPPECVQVSGFYPLDPKIAVFYEDKKYRAVVPRAIDRHAQSFQCGAEKGTFYYFLYQQPAEADTAALFARGIFSRLNPVPAIERFPNGMVVLSFKETPLSLIEALDRKIKGRGPAAPMAIRSAPPMAVVSGSPAISAFTGTTSAPVAVSSPIPVAVGSPAPVALTSPAPADLSDEIPNTLLKELDCHAKDLREETREACDLFSGFKKGAKIDPRLAPITARVGVAYRISGFGQLNARSYMALIGSGRPGEIAVVPLPVYTGVEDLEVQALITARREGKPLPASNEMTDRILKQPRPGQQTLFPTKGVSSLMSSAGQKKGFLRRSGAKWILLIVTGDHPDQQSRSDVIVAGLY